MLGCDRIDHGYYVLEDERVVARVRDEGVVFSVASTTSRRSWRPWRRASIQAMLGAGLAIVPCSDDPGMFPTTLTDEYLIMAQDIGAGHAQLRSMALTAFDASWLPDDQKSVLRASIEAEITALDEEFGFSASPGLRN